MAWSLIYDVVAHFTNGIPAFGAAILILVAARFLFLWSTPSNVSDDLIDAENPATAIVFGA